MANFNGLLVDIGLQLIDVRHLRAQSRLAASFVINVAGAREQLALAACIPLGENLSGDFARITAPSQILWGAQDVLFPATTAHHLHQTMPGSTLHLIDGGFHLWMIDRPKLAAQFVQNFIRLC